MEKILISACLAGDRVRYDGKLAPLDHPLIQEWDDQGRLVRFCPEIAGGLAMPRRPCEMVKGDGQGVLAGTAWVQTSDGTDRSREFIKGAQLALETVRQWDIRIALLKEKSPSCGKSRVYDGTFSRNLVPGMGTTTALLIRAGVAVFSEREVLEVLNWLNHYEI